MQYSDTHKKMLSCYNLLLQKEISVASFEQIRTLLRGTHPQLDEKLDICSKALHTVQKLQNGDVISLSIEALPEESEEQKKRKKAVLFFIESVKDVQSEIQRIDKELGEKGTSLRSNIWTWGRIIKFAKGPFGITTLFALFTLGIIFFLQTMQKKPSETTIQKAAQTIKIIEYHNKKLPLSQLYVGYGTDCDSPHYHAKTGSVVAIDGTVIVDPENCGYGKVKDTKIIEITSNTPTY
jgi:hypothetical protein